MIWDNYYYPCSIREGVWEVVDQDAIIVAEVDNKQKAIEIVKILKEAVRKSREVRDSSNARKQ